MLLILQISRTLVAAKPTTRMSVTRRTVSEEAMQAEWAEIQAAQAQPALFRPLYDRYFESVFRFIFRRTSDEAIAADLCSQTFLKAMQKLSTYKFQGVPFSAWLFRIATNEVAQYFRANSKNRTVSAEDVQLQDIVAEVSDTDGDKETVRQALIDSLRDLKPADLEIVELRFFEQRAFKEIAGILEITESNAKVRTYRVLERLKKHILKRL